MKKLTILLACFIGVMFFASCDPNQIDDLMSQKPNIEFYGDEEFISDNTSAYVGTELKFGIKLSTNSGSESPLVLYKFDITDATGTTVYAHEEDLTLMPDQKEFEFKEYYTSETPSLLAVTAYVKDAAGKENAVALTVNYIQPVVAEIGTFSGKLTLNGHIHSEQAYLGQQIDQDINPVELATTVKLGSVDENGRISVTFEIDGTPVTLYATQDGENLVFDEFHFTKTVNVVADFKFEIYVNATGVLADNTLTLEGTTYGTGHVDIPFVNVNADMTGDIAGTLDKQE